MENKLKVSVVMPTYGHEKFIQEAINGVLIQECDFEIELVLVNDCSPDKTDVVIQNMLNTHPRASIINYIKHEKNVGMIPNWVFGLKQCKGKYIAICEGDDYWTDPLKLQTQVEILEQNLDYGLSCTACDRYYQEFDTMITPQITSQHFSIPFEALILKSPIKTCTVVLRKKIIDDYFNQIGKKIFAWQMVDAPLWLFVSLNSEIHFTSRNTAVYRVLEKSATNVSIIPKFHFRMSRYKVSWFFLKRQFKLSLGISLFSKFLKETPILLSKIILSKLKLYEPNKMKIIERHRKKD